jgi:tRNA dimethylallyltransferase
VADARPAILIAGPTASGKSALAIDLAASFGGEVINVDSMQVYRDLRVITARPTPEEEARVPHRLFGHVDAAVNHSVAAHLRDAQQALAACDAADRLPVFVGGTGLYFKALTDGLSDMPALPDEVRAQIRDIAARCETPQLHARLAAQDPQLAARLKPNDRLRIMRGLEVFAATGRSLLSFQQAREPALLAGRPLLRLFLMPERETLRARIDARFVAMMEEGALDEVAALAARHLDPMLPAMRAHGVPALIRHLRGEIPRDEAIRIGQGDTRRYAKRQVTWFRHQMADWIAVAPEEARDVARRELCRLQVGSRAADVQYFPPPAHN